MSKHPEKEKGGEHGFHLTPPAYLQIPAPGVNISDHSIKMIRLERAGTSGGLRLAEYCNRELPEGIVVSGEIKEEDKVVDVLRKFKKDYGLQFVRVSIPEEKAYIFSLQVPSVPDDEIHETIEFQLSEHVPLSPEEAVFDVDVIERSSKRNTLQLSVSVLPRTIVQTYLDIFSKAGLIPVSFEMEAQAIARSIIPSDDTHTHMIVDMGRTRTGVSVIHKGVVRYTSTIAVGGDSLTSVVVKRLNLSFEDADKVKQEVGFVDTQENQDVYTTLVSALKTMTDEIARHIHFWEGADADEKFPQEEIHSIYLCGGNATVPGLREHIENLLKKKVQVANVWTNAFSLEGKVPDISRNESEQYATAVGLALSTE